MQLSKTTSQQGQIPYVGVRRMGQGYGWEFTARNGHMFKKGDFSTAAEAALDYDDFISRNAPNTQNTNQKLGILKPSEVLELRKKIGNIPGKTPRMRKNGRQAGKSGFIGVRACGRSFYAQINRGGEYRHLGSFRRKEDAALEYDREAVARDGSRADTNISRGLLPPLEPLTFDPNKKTPATSQPVKIDEVKPPMYGREHLTPEQERKRQIEAARRMSDADIDDYEPAPAPKPAPKPAPVVKPAARPAPAMRERSSQKAVAVATTTPADDTQAIIRTAMDALRRASERRELELIERFETAMCTVESCQTAYHDALTVAIDRAAEMDNAVAEMRKLLASRT